MLFLFKILYNKIGDNMKILIKNANLISVSEKRDKIEYGIDILVENDKIIKIDKNIKENVDKIINAKNKIVMPGLINTHMHIPMSIFRETLSGYTLQDWLTKKIWPMESKLNNNDIYYASYLSFVEMIRTGTTTGNDMYFMCDDIIKAMDKTGVRLQISRYLMNIDGDDNGQIKLNEEIDLLNKYKNHERLSFNLGIHGLYTSNDNYLNKCLDIAKNNNLSIHMHFCENEKEREDILNIHKDTPINILKNKFKDKKLILAHAVKLDEKEIDELKDMNLSISHCPVSNLKLGCGIAKINYMFENGINITLGTDGQGSGSNLDLFEVMKYTSLLQKGILENPTKMNSYDIIKMATINGAKALDLDKFIGSIEENKKADIIIINMNNIMTKPVNDIFSEIIYNVKGYDVDTTIIDGNILMENKKIKGHNIKTIIDKCEKTIKRISIDL